MLNVVSSEEALNLIRSEFKPSDRTETLSVYECTGRVLACDIVSNEYIPGFDRSVMDGYALRAADTFGCSEAIPAILNLIGKVAMGEHNELALHPGECCYIPTGGELPKGADAVVMIEYCEDYGDGTIGIMKGAAPGTNVVYKGDDLKPDTAVLHKGHTIGAAEVGTLAAMGISQIQVVKKPVIGILSTGDELVDVSAIPSEGQVRNVNSALLAAIVSSAGGEYKDFGICKDDEKEISSAIDNALSSCDALLMSGGSSAGEKDKASALLSAKGELLFHGISVKPGKPTMLAKVGEKAVFGIAGHPGAVYFIATVFVREYINKLLGSEIKRIGRKACLSVNVDSNFGRTQYLAVKLDEVAGGPIAKPIISKSGLITSLAEADGWIIIPRDKEGLAAGEEVEVFDVL